MLNNTKIKQSGFTIVELLIVIVVIAILAAISIVAYNGIQTRGNNAAAATAAENVAKKLEALNSVGGAYPTVGTSITTQLAAQAESTLTGSGLTLNTTSPSTNKPNTVYVQLCAATTPAANSVATGYKVFRWDFGNGAWQTNPDQIGGTTTNCAPLGATTSSSVQ
jgi:type IV pilus assembly protein PilA